MRKRLRDFDPQAQIAVADLTGTADHWEVFVESSRFKGLSRIEQHQQIMACFAPELKTGEVHALAIKTKVRN